MSGQRDAFVTIICGMTEVGKTYRTAREIEDYLQTDTKIGRKGRKVLIFDVNGEDEYSKYDRIDPDQIKSFTKQQVVEGRRFVNVKANRDLMTLPEIHEMVTTAINNFRNGLIVLEDIDKYMQWSKAQQITAILTGHRHQSLDVFITHQSMGKVTTSEWQNARIVRLHYQIDDPKRYENRIPNPELVKLARNVVEAQYRIIKNKRFFVYIDIRDQKFYPCDPESFKNACEKYLVDEPNAMSKALLSIGGDAKKPEDRQKAVEYFTQQKIHYID